MSEQEGNREKIKKKSKVDGYFFAERRRASRSVFHRTSRPYPLFFFQNKQKQNKNSKGIYGATDKREDFCEDDVNFYFEYMGMLAVDGDYARLDRMKSAGLAAVDLLLLMAAGENDAPKVAEMLRAGADTGAKDVDGKTAAELATNEQVLELLRDPAKAKTF